MTSILSSTKTPIGLPRHLTEEPSSVVRAATRLTITQNSPPPSITFAKTTLAFTMASTEVDQKYLGRLAKEVEKDNHLLAEMLFKILGLSLNLGSQLVAAKKQRRRTTVNSPDYLKRVWHILWLAREGLKMLEQYVIPMIGMYKELQVLTYKLRASFYHIFVLFYNNPVVSNLSISEAVITHPSNRPRRNTQTKIRPPATTTTTEPQSQSNSPSVPRDSPKDLKPPPTGFSLVNHDTIEFSPNFLVSSTDYLPIAHKCFIEALKLAEEHLWHSHSLRLAIKVEYIAFMYECLHEREASREEAKKTIAEVYEAKEGLDDEMFKDSCLLVTVLGRAMERGLKGSKREGASPVPAVPPPGMENPI